MNTEQLIQFLNERIEASKRAQERIENSDLSDDSKFHQCQHHQGEIQAYWRVLAYLEGIGYEVQK